MSRAEHEQALLGALLLDNGRFAEVSRLVEDDDFSCDAHRQIYRTMRTYLRIGTKVNPYTLRDAFFFSRAQFPKADPVQYLVDIAVSAAGRALVYGRVKHIPTPLHLYALAVARPKPEQSVYDVLRQHGKTL